MKDRIRRLVFKIIGYPSDVQNLLDFIDSFDSDICIYPGGDFKFGVKVSANQSEDQILTFPTPQERAAFGAGLSYGIKTMGGQSEFLTDQQLKEYEEMENLSSLKGNPKKVH